MGGTYSRSKYDKTAYHEKFFFDLIPGDAASGKTVAVTGATANGLGIWLAKHAVLLGAKRVVLLNRVSPRNAPALAEVIAFSKECGSTSTEILGVECDLLSFASVRNAAKQLNLICKHDGLDVLCLNAGTMAAPDENTDDGYNREVQVNFLAQHLLLKEVFPSLKKAAARTGDARVVQQSSGARMIPGKKGLVKAFFQKREQDSQNVSLPSGLRGDQKKGAGMLMLGPAW
jgi:NAD(P)-dependent dehydrogenase (short-subunit alcohol dehydrogenase family)|tara:strand:- start:1397 stop:2086 length:690 start_codon:yes stop_codon:yes gene_type:complete